MFISVLAREISFFIQQTHITSSTWIVKIIHLLKSLIAIKDMPIEFSSTSNF